MNFAMNLTPNGPVMPPGAPRGGKGVIEARQVSAVRGAHQFALLGMSPNPGSLGGIVKLVLPDAAPASIEMFDVEGRRVWSRDIEGLGAGEHAVPVGHGSWLPPGVYLLRLSQGGLAATARITLVH
jgi:hypothetical protein